MIKIYSVAGVIIGIIMLGLLLTSCSSNKFKTKDIFNLDTTKSIVISIAWDTEEPEFIFISPSGVKFDPKTDPDAIKWSDNKLFYRILDAEKGQWKIKYDKKLNKNIDITVDDYFKG